MPAAACTAIIFISTPIGDIELVNNYFDADASKRLFDEMDYQRAVQSYLWSHPLVSVTTWRNRQNKAFGVTGANDFVVLKSLREKRGIVTGNLTTPYNLTEPFHAQLKNAYDSGRLRGVDHAGDVTLGANVVVSASVWGRRSHWTTTRGCRSSSQAPFTRYT